MNTLRILIVTGTMEVGGIENQMMNLLRQADKSKYQIDFTTTEEHPYYEDEIRSLGSRCVHIPDTGKKHYYRYCKAIYRVMKDGQYDVVHSNELFHSGMVLLMARLAGVRQRFAHAHSSNQSYGFNPIRRLYHRLMRRLILNNATCFLACSSAAGEFLYGRSIHNSNNYHVVFNTVDTNRFLPNEAETRDSSPGDQKTVLQVGRFSDEKNFLFSVQVAATCRDRGDNFHFSFVGNSGNSYEVQVCEYIRKQGLEDTVSLLGVRKDVNLLMRQADLFILPSKYEGMPLTLIEAQAACLPCVVADTFSHEVDFGIDAVTWLPPDASAEEWATTLERVSHRKKPNRQTVENAIQKGGFDTSQFVERITSLYSEACSNQ